MAPLSTESAPTPCARTLKITHMHTKSVCLWKDLCMAVPSPSNLEIVANSHFD
jgi:hypothetical protein